MTSPHTSLSSETNQGSCAPSSPPSVSTNETTVPSPPPTGVAASPPPTALTPVPAELVVPSEAKVVSPPTVSAELVVSPPAEVVCPAVVEVVSPPAGEVASRQYIEEGTVKILSSDLTGLDEVKDVKDDGHRSLVFYNPSQRLNRDISLIALKCFAELKIASSFKKLADLKRTDGKRIVRVPDIIKGVRILEPLAASGLRSLRYAKELPASHVQRVLASDWDSSAVSRINENARLNQLPEELLHVYNEEATNLMYCSSYILRDDDKMKSYPGKSQRANWHVIDLDPFGSAIPFLDAAIQSICDGGLLCLTCTDMIVLGGNAVDVAFSKYGGATLRGVKYLHELSLRLVLHQVKMTAAKYKRFIHPLLSLSMDFYVRLFVEVRDKPIECMSAIGETGVVFQCSQCESYVVQKFGEPQERLTRAERRRKRKFAETETATKTENANHQKFTNAKVDDNVSSACGICGGKYLMGGPFYTGPLHDVDFVKRCLAEVEKIDKRRSAKEVTTEVSPVGSSEASPVVASSSGKSSSSRSTQDEMGGDAETSEWVESKERSFKFDCAHHVLSGVSLVSHIFGILKSIEIGDLPHVALSYHLPSLCTSLKGQVMQHKIIKSALLNLGYEVGFFYREPESLKTNAPPDVVYDVLQGWYDANNPDLRSKMSNSDSSQLRMAWARRPFLNGPIDFTEHPNAVLDKRNPLWCPNPTPNWGPGSRSK